MFFVKILTIITITIAILIAVYLRANTLDKSSTISEFYKNNMDTSTDVALWANGGAYFRWRSELLENKALPELNIFYRTFGNIENPAIVSAVSTARAMDFASSCIFVTNPLLIPNDACWPKPKT